jgi:hypothetical protein
MNQDDLRRIVLALPEAREGSHMEHPDFRVRDRIFATLHPDGRTANFRVAPENLDALIAAEPATYRAVWGGRYLAVDLRRVKVAALRALAADAWCLAAPKSLVAGFRAGTPSAPPVRPGKRSARRRRA